MQKVGDEQCYASMKGLIQKKKEEIDITAVPTDGGGKATAIRSRNMASTSAALVGHHL
jgi:hypothetical protein